MRRRLRQRPRMTPDAELRSVVMRVATIEEVSDLSRAELRLAQRCMYWPENAAQQRELRAYRLEGGGVLVAPGNPAIEPGMDIVAIGGIAMAFEDSFGERGRASLELQCARAVTER